MYRAGVFPKVSRTLTTSWNPLHQGVEVPPGSLSLASSGWWETMRVLCVLCVLCVVDLFEEVCRHRSSSQGLGTWESLLAV